ncbi:MAG: J domain-containing protein [Proteobacteria bacterium]|nr:J domain-containing protein [Pseudomonadota bacterium]
MRAEGYRDLVKVSVEIELNTSKVLLGIMEKPRSKSLIDYMNGSEPFIELHHFEGSVLQVAKASILYCRQRDNEKADPLGSMLKSADVDNPLTVLGIKAAESKEQVRQAYLARMRMYHSDRYGGIDLPSEVVQHMATMTKRISVAYRDALALCEQHARQAS